ncbi:MAG: hypothetical protein LBH47_01150 [Christensenellaceae bacterium]|jgi:transcriptional regulator of heat shock response|nr:hypothetical protein [Christensenellaceae bacterium]
MNKRLKEVLSVGVKYYVRTLLPITSAIIAETVPKSSATIRNDLKILEEMGYLRQLHVSGGRVPTKAGYEEFMEDEREVKEVNSLSNVIIEISNKIWGLPNLENYEITAVSILPMIDGRIMFLAKTNAGCITTKIGTETPLTNMQADVASNAIASYLRGITLDELTRLGQIYINTGPPQEKLLLTLKGGGG